MATLKYRRIGAFLWWGGYQAVEDFSIKTSITGFSVETRFIRLDPDGLLTLKKWFIWDGPTGGVKTKDFVAGSGVHDALCNLINMGLLPKSIQCLVDEEMLRINTSQRMHWFRRAYTYAAVRWYQARKKNPFSPKIYEIEVTV